MSVIHIIIGEPTTYEAYFILNLLQFSIKER